MGFSKQQLLARLKELQIPFSQYEHPVVLTVDAQKSRLYVVSALAVLSQRLGLGKGGLRMAPEEALGEVLQVPLGCVTPFALVNESARDVSLLLDQGFKSQKHCFFHPLSNDMSIWNSFASICSTPWVHQFFHAYYLTILELKYSWCFFLKSIGRNRSYVDLEANPKVGKDQPPDLAALVPSGLIVLPDQPQKQSSSQVPEDANHVSMDNGTNTVSAKVVKPSSGRKSSKGTPAKNVNSSGSFADAGQFVEEILQKTSQLLLSEVKDENIKLHGEQLGTVLSDKLLKNLNAEFKNLAMIFKNTAYTEGFHAGTHYRPPLM
ncbi:hypothetical protein AAZV13_04G207500 [Glycine max]